MWFNDKSIFFNLDRTIADRKTKIFACCYFEGITMIYLKKKNGRFILTHLMDTIFYEQPCAHFNFKEILLLEFYFKFISTLHRVNN